MVGRPLGRNRRGRRPKRAQRVLLGARRQLPYPERNRQACRETTLEGWQIIGWIRSWTFDGEGGFAAGWWTREGDRWLLRETGITPDGSRHDARNQRADQRQQARNDFQQNRDQRWNDLESAREDRQAWRDHNREDWQQHREDLWEYRGDRAEEIWDNARDFHDDVFDDRWWGTWGWGVGWVGNYPANPWWWWTPAAFTAAAAFVDLVTPEPVYVDYGMNVVYENDTVYVDNQPIPTEQYSQPVLGCSRAA